MAKKTKQGKKQEGIEVKQNASFDGVKVGLMIVQTILLIIIIGMLANHGDYKSSDTDSGNGAIDVKQGAPNAPNAPAAPSAVKGDLTDDDAVKGNPNAPVTMVEFSDYQCPFCGRYYAQTRPQIMKEYVDTGKVKLVFRDFPLSFHPNAQKASEAAECAGEQGKYWEMHDKLYDNQKDLGIVNYKKWARELGLDGTKFDTCLDTGAMVNEIKKDMADGQAAGVKGTPGFFINGRELRGAQPYSAFKAIIDEELAKAK